MLAIPPEIRDLIIDCLHADRTALQACCLTARAWLPRARSHLFRRITLDSGHHGDVFRRLTESTPELRRYVQHVEVSGSVGAKRCWWDSDSHSSPVIAWPTFRQQPQRRGESGVLETVSWVQRVLRVDDAPLCNVRTLSLVEIPVSGAVARALLPHFVNVTEIAFSDCKALAFGDFVDFLCSFPRVESLRVLGIQWLPHGTRAVNETALLPPRLKRLELSRKIDIPRLVSWMLAQFVHLDISSLTCTISCQQAAAALRDLLKMAGPSLEHLTFGFQEARNPTDDLRAGELDLTACTGLRSLHFLCSSPFLSGPRPSLSWVIILLSKLKSAHLQTVAFSIRASDVCALNLQGLELILCNARFDGLKAVEFVLEPGTAQVAPEVFVRTRMPMLSAKGILRFES